MTRLHIDKVDLDALEERADPFVTQWVTDEGAQSLKMACHALRAGHELELSGEAVSHVIYVWRGSVEVGEQALRAGSAVAVEVGGELTVRAAEDTLLMDFHERAPNLSRKSGGDVHVVASGEVEGGEDPIGLGFHTVYLDAQCKSCDVWLHESRFYADREIMQHYHTEDEVIFICSGELHLGRHVLTAGTALAIAANTPYRFKAGSEGVSFVNFRPKSPTIVLSVEGKEARVLDEAEAFARLVSDRS